MHLNGSSVIKILLISSVLFLALNLSGQSRDNAVKLSYQLGSLPYYGNFGHGLDLQVERKIRRRVSIALGLGYRRIDNSTDAKFFNFNTIAKEEIGYIDVDFYHDFLKFSEKHDLKIGAGFSFFMERLRYASEIWSESGNLTRVVYKTSNRRYGAMGLKVDYCLDFTEAIFFNARVAIKSPFLAETLDVVAQEFGTEPISVERFAQPIVAFLLGLGYRF